VGVTAENLKQDVVTGPGAADDPLIITDGRNGLPVDLEHNIAFLETSPLGDATWCFVQDDNTLLILLESVRLGNVFIDIRHSETQCFVVRLTLRRGV
jgi:hypothetical protein